MEVSNTEEAEKNRDARKEEELRKETELRYNATCNYCGAKIKFAHCDIKVNQRFEIYYIDCPICKTPILYDKDMEEISNGKKKIR